MFRVLGVRAMVVFGLGNVVMLVMGYVVVWGFGFGVDMISV